MRIRSGLHLALSGSAGFDLSDPLDCHAWLLDSGAGWVMVDAGAGRDASGTLATIAASGVDPAGIRWLLLTHGHADHSGGAAGLRQALGLQVIAGAATARMVSAGDTAALGLDRARRAGVYPEDYRYLPCPVDREVAPGETLALGGLALEVVAAPGHSHDHLCFRTRQADGVLLLAGDALFYGGRVTWQDTADCDVAATCDTVRRLAALEFDALLPGHGGFSLANGHRHAAQALARVQRLLAPESFG
jgi:glyoxylase-like metal-dependent hydrolase (beta-lactamase superfamily II)